MLKGNGMMKMVILGIAAAALTGCAGYSVEKDGCGLGYDVYAPEPYLKREPITAADSTSITGFKFELIWLPNYSKRYRVRSWAGLGSADFEFDFEEGWKLTKVVDKSTNSAILGQIVDLAKHLTPAGALGFRGSGEGGQPRDLIADSATPVLYRIVFDECGRPTRLERLCVSSCGGETETRPLR